MEAALRLADHVDEDAILAMHRELLHRQPGWADHAGRNRDQLVWAGTSSITPRGAAHVGAQAQLVPAAIGDLVRFMRRQDLQVVVQAVVAHAQFETIHPLSDGNGRTGRALVHAMIRAKGLVRSTTAPISAGLLINTTGYTDALGAYRAGDARPIIERFSEASASPHDPGPPSSTTSPPRSTRDPRRCTPPGSAHRPSPGWCSPTWPLNR